MTTSRWHLAQINIARTRAPLTDPLMATFVAQIDEINRLAEETDGFIWRLKDEAGAASSYVKFGDDDRIIVNMTVWVSIEALHSYVYRSHHVSVFRERARWFEPLGTAGLAMWWVPAGHVPSIDEGRDRLAMLDASGPTAEAFTFKHRFPPPE